MMPRIFKGGYTPRLAAHWDGLQQDTHYGPTAEFLLSQLKSRGLPLRIFEVGCGTGLLAESLISSGAEFIGLWDRSPEMRDVTQERLKQHWGSSVNWMNPNSKREDHGQFGAYLGQRMSPPLPELYSMISHAGTMLGKGGLLLLSYWTGQAVNNFNAVDWPPVDIHAVASRSCIRLNSWEFHGINGIDHWRFACLYVENSKVDIEFGEFELPRLKGSDVTKVFADAEMAPLEIPMEQLTAMGFTIAGVKK